MSSLYSISGGSGGGSGTTSDTAGTAVIGSAGSPVTFTSSDTVQVGLTDVTAYKQCTWYVIITDRDTVTPTNTVEVRIDWTADSGTTFNTQGTEAIAAGASACRPFRCRSSHPKFACESRSMQARQTATSSSHARSRKA
jgi:hypothetical protein